MAGVLSAFLTRIIGRYAGKVSEQTRSAARLHDWDQILGAEHRVWLISADSPQLGLHGVFHVVGGDTANCSLVT